MSERKEYPHGCPCWIELAAQDVELAKRFYTGLFGWEAKDREDGPGGLQTVYHKDGKAVCSQASLAPKAAAKGVPTHWQTFLAVDDLDKALERVVKQGAKISAGPLHNPGASWTATILDPAGAPVSLWQADGISGAEVVNDLHTWCWSELQAHDTVAALNFYSKTFGWGAKVAEGVGAGYTNFLLNDRKVAGLVQVQPVWGVRATPAWNVYFAVEDLPAAKSRAQELSGRAITPPMEAEGIGIFQLFTDSQGAHLCLIEIEEGVELD